MTFVTYIVKTKIVKMNLLHIMDHIILQNQIVQTLLKVNLNLLQVIQNPT